MLSTTDTFHRDSCYFTLKVSYFGKCSYSLFPLLINKSTGNRNIAKFDEKRNPIIVRNCKDFNRTLNGK